MGAQVSTNEKALVEAVFTKHMKGYVTSEVYGIDCEHRFLDLAKASAVLDVFERPDLLEDNEVECMSFAFLDLVPDFIDRGSVAQSDALPDDENVFQPIRVQNSLGTLIAIISQRPDNNVYNVSTLIPHRDSDGQQVPTLIGQGFTATLCQAIPAADRNFILRFDDSVHPFVIEEGDIVKMVDEKHEHFA